jgi:signal transduction histidine kinase
MNGQRSRKMKMENDRLPTLSDMVRGFLFRWLLLPALGIVVCFSGIWCLSKAHDFARQQQFLVRSAGDYIQTGLNVCDTQMQRAADDLFRRYTTEAVLLQLSMNIYFKTAYLLDPSGRTLHAMPRQADKRDFSGLIRLPVPRNEFVLTAPYYSRFAGRIVVGMVREVSGDYLLLTELNLTHLQEVILNLNRRLHAGYAFMTDEYGNLLTHRDMSRVERQENVGHMAILTSSRKDPSASGYYREPDGVMLMSAVALPMGNWKLVIAQDAVTLFQPILVTVLVLLAVVLGLYFLVFFLLNRQMQRILVDPLKNFAREIETVKQGDYHAETLSSINTGVKGFKELTFLHNNFVQMQQVLREREADLRQSDEILNNTDSIAVFKDTRLSYIKVNHAYLQLTGHDKPDAVVGKTDADLFRDLATKEQMQAFMDNDRRALTLAPGQTLTIEEYLPGQNGSIRIFLTKKFPVYNTSHDTLLGVATLSTEITARKQAEEQLNQAQKMESVGRLAGGVAHDFNNMLTAIMGYTQAAIDEMDPAGPVYHYLQEVLQAAGRSADLTRQLLAFARKQAIEPRILDLNRTINKMMNMLHRLIGEDIHMVFNPAENLWQIKMDPSQIDQILANLCVNAKDAISGFGTITIQTGMKSVDQADCADNADCIPGEYVLLTVSDSGHGMDKDTLARIFEPFFTTKELGKGTGLGLATIYGIVRQNNGFIHVTSNPGQGTTFTIHLPRYASSFREPVDEKPAPSPAAKGTETILVVEDEPTILDMTRMMLERQGYTVLTAGTPGEALALAETHQDKIHLVLTDVIMPEMNGRDLGRRVQALYPDIRCLYMSGYTADVIAHQGVLDQGTRFIQKPFSLRDLAALVREILDV